MRYDLVLWKNEIIQPLKSSISLLQYYCDYYLLQEWRKYEKETEKNIH